jgi:hypothetical protein
MGSPTPPEPPVQELVEMPERCSRARVRYAAPKAGAPLRAARRSGRDDYATGGSGGMGLGSLIFEPKKTGASSVLRSDFGENEAKYQTARWAKLE